MLSAVLQALATFAPVWLRWSWPDAPLVGGPQKSAQPLGRYRVGGAWYALALLGPPLLMAAAVALHVALGGRPPDLPDAGRWLLIPGLLVLVLLIGGPLGEEPGWRGYALPILQRRFGPVTGALVLGLVWAVWHLPLRLIPGTPQAQLHSC
jgi:membrane protease YdiL (CAAX protease family)